MNKFILRNIAVCYQDRNPTRLLCGDSPISKNFKNLSLVESLFNWNKWPQWKFWKIFIKVYVMKFFFIDKVSPLQSTAYHRTNNSTRNTFLEVLRMERMFSNFWKLLRKFSKTTPFSLTLQACSLEFRASTKKSVVCECSEIVWNLPGLLTGLLSKIYTLLKKTTSFIFQGMFGKGAVLKVSEN